MISVFKKSGGHICGCPNDAGDRSALDGRHFCGRCGLEYVVIAVGQGMPLGPTGPNHLAHDCVDASRHEQLERRYNELVTERARLQGELRAANERHARQEGPFKHALDAANKRIEMLEAERGPGIKHEPEMRVECDIDWD